MWQVFDFHWPRHPGTCTAAMEARGSTVEYFRMYMFGDIMYISSVVRTVRGNQMATGRNRVHKHFQLDSVKIRRAKKVLQAKTETEAIELALDLVISEHEKNRVAAEANEAFLNSGIQIKDVYGKLGE
jgi:hypothetical protein